MPGALNTFFSSADSIKRGHQLAATFASLLLIAAIAWQLSRLSWLFLPGEEAPGAPRLTARTPQATPTENPHFRQLTQAQLLGEAKTEHKPAPTKAPVTRLNLTLKGVLAAEPMTLASAIIAQGRNGKEEIYGIGDKLKGGVTIREIHPDHVVLDRRGRLEILKLPKNNALNSGGTGKRLDLGAYNRASRPLTPGQRLGQIRREILKSPTSFGDYALPVVVRKNGKQLGYRLQPQAKGALLAELGLQPSDIITEVNGVKLDKPQNGITALRKLSTARQLNLVVKRNGVDVPLSIQLQ